MLIAYNNSLYYYCWLANYDDKRIS